MKSHAFSGLGKTLGRNGRAAAEPFVAGYLPALLAQMHALAAGEFHRTATALGCPPAEWKVLATLAEGQPVSIGKLAETVVMKQPTLTRVLDRMVATGQVQRVRHAEDRRVILVNITPAGQKVVRQLLPLAREQEERILQAIGPRRAADVKAGLQQLIAIHGPVAPV